MKFLTSSFIFATILASTTLASASGHSDVHSPAIRRQHNKRVCSSSTCHTKKSKVNKSKGRPDALSLKGGKAGLCWANADGIPIDNFIKGGVSWSYSWSELPGWSGFPIDELLFCPMLWGWKNADNFKKNVVNNQNSKFNKHKCAFGMNEVNQKGQADMSPADGCKLMRENMTPLKKNGWYIIGPSTTNAPNGETWYDSFKKTCPDVWNELDAIAIHYYGTSSSDFKQYVSKWHKKYGKDIWVTEFACTNFNGGPQKSSDEVFAFGEDVKKWMDQQDYIRGYAPFAVINNLQGVSEANRLANGNRPTSLFNMYVGA